MASADSYLEDMPKIGLGTWNSAPGEVGGAVAAALEAGYRHIDCAYLYGNEPEVGEALKAAFDAGTVSRGDIWLTSKVFNHMHGEEGARESCAASLEALGVEVLDLLLIHWPIAFDCIPEGGLRDETGKPRAELRAREDFMSTWHALEALQAEGKCRHIGVSNFTVAQLQKVLDEGSVKPFCNQVEMHPYLSQEELLAFCKAEGIRVTAYSPLGSPASYSGRLKEVTPLLAHDVVAAVAEEAGKTAGQVVLRWGMQRGEVVIPKSVTPSRIVENLAAADDDWELSEDAMARLSALNIPYRYGKGFLPDHYLNVAVAPSKLAEAAEAAEKAGDE